MKIFAYNSGHDGAWIDLDGGRLISCIESEKDSGERFDRLSLPVFLNSLRFEHHPDVLAISTFAGLVSKTVESEGDKYSLYSDEKKSSGTSERTVLFAGRQIPLFLSSHVRSHIMCAYGLSPFPQGQACHVLVWEGVIGAFYHVDEQVVISKIGDVVPFPGSKYTFPYALANSSLTTADPAGKMMALAAYGRCGPPTQAEQEMVNMILSAEIEETLPVWKTAKSKFDDTAYYKIGIESQPFKDLARQLSTAIFGRFYAFASKHVQRHLPLLIVGGCGLNCAWNSQWKRCGLYTDVFVPPCANDSGVALGAAVDAQYHYTGQAKVDWTVYAGEPFIEDVASPASMKCEELSLAAVCSFLKDGNVVAWVQGRYEMGPRALGNRSLLAAPFATATRDRLNRIKQREFFRPIAPVCMEEEFNVHFENDGLSPHMLYFQRVKTKALAAVTHIDGSARAQSVSQNENSKLWELLREFRAQTGFGVLCNTSLNFSGRGFINRLSQLFKLAIQQEIDGIVVGNRFWQVKHRPA